jgi:glycosyltransferase involved in cell wall biosynthesis
MRFWLLTTEFPPFFGGGISTYCRITARMFAERGHEVTVFVNDSSVNEITISHADGMRLVRFSPYRSGASAHLGHVANISYEFAMVVKEFVEKEGAPDLVEAQEYLGIAYYLLQFRHLLYDWCRNIPVLITMHSPSFLYMEYNHISEYKYPNYWICEMERFCLQAADQVISPSHYILRELKGHFELKQPHVEVVPNPFDSTGDLQQENTSGDEIVFYGKLTVQKGAFKLLAYFEQLWNKGFDQPLYLVGGQDIVYHPEGRTMGDLIRKKYSHFISQGLLRLEDRISPHQIAERLARAKVVIIPSANDNLPYVAFEMMSLGKVVLVSKQGGHSEVVRDGVDGFIFDHEHPETFELQLRRALALSPGERGSIGRNAVQRVAEGYGPGVIYGRKIAVIEQMRQRSVRAGAFPFIRVNSVEAPAAGNRLLSVVVPYYNMGKYIGEAVDSIRQSGYGEKEILIVNDGSTEEESLARLREYENAPDVRVIHSHNQGLAATRNLGASQARGGFLAFLDADDRVEPAYYEKAIRVLEGCTNVHFVGCWVRYFGASANTWPAFVPEPPLILYQNTVNSSALVYKTQSFLQNGLNDSRMVFAGWEDYESVVSMVAAGHGGVVLPEGLFHYRVRPDSMIRAISKDKKIYLNEYIAGKHKSIYVNFAPEIIGLLQANGPAHLIDNPTLDYAVYSRNPWLNKLTRKAVAIVKNNPKLKKAALTIYRKLKS